MSVCIIPARGGSRRVPLKNIRPFFGVPIIAYSIYTANESFDVVYVSTDDEDIAKTAERFGAKVIWRAPELCRDEVGTQEVTKSVIEELALKDDEQVCCLYATAPMVTREDLLVAKWIQVCRPATFVVAVGTEPLRDAGAFYVGCAGDFRHHPLWSIRTQVYPLPEERVCDINTEEDFAEAVKKFQALKDLA